MEYQVKLNEKCMPILHCISSFEDISHKILEDRATSSSFVLQQLLQRDFSQFFRTSFNINYLKKDFCHKLSFFNGFTETPCPLKDQNPLSVTKVFC